MQDRTRFFLSVFMFAILAFNPLAFLLPDSFSAATHLGDAGTGSSGVQDAHTGGRSLLFKFTDDAPGSSEWWYWSFPTMAIWAVNAVITIYIIAHIFMFGEPVTKDGSDASTCYWRNRRQADIDLGRVRAEYLRFFDLIVTLNDCAQPQSLRDGL